jgi:endonuclease III
MYFFGGKDVLIGDDNAMLKGLVLYGRYVCGALPHDCGEHPLTKIWPEAIHRWPKAK